MMKRKQILPSMNNISLNKSWEEKAFAEDAAGALGGCIWPPRSYTCNFCNREFRSAQALGGHMNVHRRDRARLKQSVSPNINEALNHQNHSNSRVSLSAALSISETVVEKTPREDSISCVGYVETDLSVGMNNSFVSQNRPTGSCGDEAAAVSCKRPKTAVSSLSFFLKTCSDDTYNDLQSEVIGILKPNNTMEDHLDLELRLGDPPKVK